MAIILCWKLTSKYIFPKRNRRTISGNHDIYTSHGNKCHRLTRLKFWSLWLMSVCVIIFRSFYFFSVCLAWLGFWLLFRHSCTFPCTRPMTKAQCVIFKHSFCAASDMDIIHFILANTLEQITQKHSYDMAIQHIVLSNAVLLRGNTHHTRDWCAFLLFTGKCRVAGKDICEHNFQIIISCDCAVIKHKGICVSCANTMYVPFGDRSSHR